MATVEELQAALDQLLLEEALVEAKAEGQRPSAELRNQVREARRVYRTLRQEGYGK